MKKIKSICFVVNKYPNKYEPYMLIFLQQLAWKMADMGLNVTVIYPCPVNINPKLNKLPYHVLEKTDQGSTISVYYPKTIGFGQSHTFFGKSPVGITAHFMYEAAVRVLTKENIIPDVFYGHFLAPSGVAALRVAKKFGKPCFFAYGESHDTIKQYGQKKSKKIINEFDGIISVSTDLKNELITRVNCSNNRIGVFPNSINVNRFYKMDKKQCREHFNLPKDDIIVAFVGGFNERKGILRVCAAMNEISNAKLICAGAGDQTPFGSNCIFAQPLHPEEISMFNNAADIFVLPTKKEGCCNAIVEAMACGLPIISSNLAFNDDILDENCSIRINPDSVPEIKNSIELLVNNAALREELSIGALQKANSLTLENRTRNIIDFINERVNQQSEC